MSEANGARPDEAAAAPPVAAAEPPRHAALSIRWIVTVAAATLTTAAVLTVGAVSERATRRALTREIEARLLLESRNLALTSGEVLLTDYPELTLHPLVREMRARQPELALALVVDNQGRIQGERDARLLGTLHVPDPRLREVAGTQPLGRGERLLGDGVVLAAATPVTHRNGRRIGTAIVGLHTAYVDGMLAEARREQALVLGGVLALVLVLSFLLLSFVLRPVQTLRAGIERIGRGDLDTPLRLRDRTELGLLAQAVNRMAAALKRAQSEMVERERLAHEVELARQIQSSLLPNRSKEIGGFVIEGSQRAAAEVGGDFFDYFVLPDGRIGVAVADVAGKGLAGCLVMSMLSALLRAYRSEIRSPAELLRVLDERLGETLQTGSFVTMFYGILDPASGELVYASAGHSPLLVYRRARGAVEWFYTRGIPLGAVRGGAIAGTLADATLRLEPRHLFLQIADAGNEAGDPTGTEQFGLDRMAGVVQESAHRGCSGVIAALHGGTESWTQSGPAFDDETVLVVCREAAAAARPRRAGAADPEEAAALRSLEAARARGRRLRLPADLDALHELRPWLERQVPHAGGPRFELLVTALYEACANVAEHGLGLAAGEELELWWVPGSLDAPPSFPAPIAPRAAAGADDEGHFLIRDHGAPFRADSWTGTDFSDRTTWLRGRGFGLDIIHRAMSRVEYHPGTAEGNLTLLVFDFEPVAEARRA